MNKEKFRVYVDIAKGQDQTAVCISNGSKIIEILNGEAADAVAELLAETARLKAALETIAKGFDGAMPIGDPWAFYNDQCVYAREALNPTPPEKQGEA